MQPTPVPSVYCTHCHRDVTYHYRAINHWKELLLTLFTCGIWLPMWLFSTLGPAKICDNCNQSIWED